MGWLVRELEDGRVHVIPDTDGQPHDLDAGCWCRPDPPNNDDGVFVHRDQLDRAVAVP